MEHKITKLEMNKKPKEKPLSLHGMKVNDASRVILNTPAIQKKNIFAVKCDNVWEKFGDKSALFKVIINEREYQKVGEFRIQLNPIRISLSIRPALDGEAGSHQQFHLSQEAVDSIQPVIGQKHYQFQVHATLNHLQSRE